MSPSNALRSFPRTIGRNYLLLKTQEHHCWPFIVYIEVMAHLEARKHVSPDSGFPIVIHPAFNPKIKSHVPPDPVREQVFPDKDRATFADPEKKALFSVAKPVV